LDVLSFQHGEALVIEFAEDEHTVWWHSVGRVFLRVVVIGPMAMPVISGTASVKALDGSALPPAPAPRVAWDESFRYYRISQATDDLLDAYRSMYLALESLLSDIRPKQSGEGEGAWLTAALTEASRRISLGSYVPAVVPDAIAFLKKDLYESHRNQVFHSKRAQATTLPFDAAKREAIADSFWRLSHIYVALAQQRTGTQRSRTSFSRATTRAFLGAGLVNGRLCVTDDISPWDADAKEPQRLAGTVADLQTVLLPSNEEDQHVALLGERDRDGTIGFPLIQRIAVLGTDGGIVTTYELGGPLTLDGVNRLEALFGLRAHNTRDLRARFGT
jgi:hypothetical protein